MNVQKRLGRFKQWAGERMGGDAKTDVSDEFKALEMEMSLRHEGGSPSYIHWNPILTLAGMKENQKAMNSYVKALSKRSEGEDRDKQLAVGAMGQAMSRHGEEFESDSEFGQCLIGLSSAPLWGRALLTSSSHGSNKRTCGTRSGFLRRASNFNMA